jgi:hypothetical protein
VRDSADLKAEILAWQDRALDEQFVTGPVELLQRALLLKRDGRREPPTH